VIGALEGDVAVLAGDRARQPQRRHDGLGPRVREAHQFGAGHHVVDQFGDRHLALGAERKHGADVLAFARRRIHLGMAVAEDDRAIAQPVVDIDIVIEVPDSRPAAALDVDRLVVAPVAEVGADAERQTPVRLLEVGV
jgi:hypothetical protein